MPHLKTRLKLAIGSAIVLAVMVPGVAEAAFRITKVH